MIIYRKGIMKQIVITCLLSCPCFGMQSNVPEHELQHVKSSKLEELEQRLDTLRKLYRHGDMKEGDFLEYHQILLQVMREKKIDTEGEDE